MSGFRELKGISPLVAVITLIAFTLIIAGFLANWATQLTVMQTRDIQECLGAQAVIQGATYSSGNLNIYVNNRGDADLTFDAIVTYENGSIYKYTDYAADSGELITIPLTGIDSTLSEVSVESQECRGAQDFVGKSWINGL